MISIIIPTFNEERRIGNCIRAILSSRYKDYEIIIADDYSTDKTAEIVSKYPCRVIKGDRHGGPAYARNSALPYARGDVLFFIDADITIREDTLEKIVGTFEERPEIGAVLCIRTKESLNEDLSGYSKGLTPNYWALSKFYSYTMSKVDYATFFSTNRGAIKRDVFNIVGKFDTKYKEADFEDYQIGYAITDRGHRIYIDRDIQILHRFPGFRASIKKFFRKGGLYTKDVILKRKKADNVDVTFFRILRAGLAFLSFIFLLVSPFFRSAILFFGLSLAALIATNLRFYAFVFKEKGLFQVLAFLWIEYVLSIVGILGTITAVLVPSRINLQNHFHAYRKLAKKIRPLLNKRLPSYIILFITSRCQCRCKTCFNWRNIDDAENRKELSLNEIEKISKNLNRLSKLTLSGGEPFLRDDLPQICKIFYRNNKVDFITIPTNCLLPLKIKGVSETILKECKGTHLKLQLSLDGLYTDHDEIRGVEGNFQKVLQAYSELCGIKREFDNLEIAIETTFSAFNQDKINEIIYFVNRDLPGASHIISLARGDTCDKEAKRFSLQRYEDAIRYLNDISKNSIGSQGPFSRLFYMARFRTRKTSIEALKTKRMVVPCVAGKKMVIISDIGDVYPCEMLNFKIGNLRRDNYDLQEIMVSREAEGVRRYIKKKSCFCSFECAIGYSLAFNFKESLRLLSSLSVN